MTSAEALAHTAETLGAVLIAVGLAAGAFRRHAVAAALGMSLAVLGAAVFLAARPERAPRGLAFALLVVGAAAAWGMLAIFAQWRRLDRTSDLAALDQEPPDA